AEAEAEAENELSSRYEVTLHLGRGAYGYVKAAVRRSDGAQLAAHQLMERPESLGGGLVPREAAILQSVSHPNIVPLLDALESRRYYELVMPRHGLGMDLFEFIDRNPSLDEPLASYMFRQMASAVAYLHSRGIAHRDLKDENVILDERFCLMLIDFGAAAFVSPDRPFSVFCGTMEYCAPEILQGHPYFGPEADVWSLGVTLYTLVFGENPFFDVDETLAGVLKPQWKPSPQLSRLLRVMLQVDPKLRAGICEVERHPWTTQPVNIDCYNFEDVLPNCHSRHFMDAGAAALATAAPLAAQHPIHHQQHQHGVNQRTRTVQLSRSRIGFGFTINGQSPCMLSCIVPGSPADLAALRPGDALLARRQRRLRARPGSRRRGRCHRQVRWPAHADSGT
uniref:Protein kinase domain-containing protein n=1 Tax=Macrostomum lignano TaxID=282301 RepID=A0A1I8F587_9PLAT